MNKTKELCCLDKNIKSDKLKEYIFCAAHHEFDYLCVPNYYIPIVKELTTQLKISASIDFPYGLSPPNIVNSMIIDAAKKGANCVDITLNNSIIHDSNWKKFKEITKTQIIIAKQHKVDIRAVLEYSLHLNLTNFATCNLLKNFGIETVILSTGTLNNDITDMMTFAYTLQKETDINIIFSAQTWLPKHHEQFIDSPIKGGIRFYNLNAVRRCII